MSTQSEAKVRLEKWRWAIKVAHNSHIRAAVYYNKRGRMLGVPVVIFTTIVGTAVFTSIATSGTSSVALQVIAGTLSIIAAVLSSLNTFLNYGELAERHRSASVKYGNIRREIEQIECFMDTKTDLETIMKDIRTRWDAVDLETPEVPQDIHDKVVSELHEKAKREIKK